VESAVLRLTPLARPLVPDALVPAFRRLVVGLFGFRRKQLVRGLRELTGWPPDRVLELVAAASAAPTDRPEVLTPHQFVALAGAVVDAGWPPAADL
jgi:16S rRNA (adenine1518-N6/adenine1519-N6)-dimethyltransferase